MIRIRRSGAVAPPELIAVGRSSLDQVIRPRATAEPPILTTDDFDRVYSKMKVRRVLWDLQHGKCCYCEKQIEIKFATVEHYRPKARAIDEHGGKRLGYWWLGYAFENLYLCCPNCNNLKGDFFPLAAGTQPLPPEEKPWSSSITEPALVLDPGFEDPEPHISWVLYGDRVRPVDNDPRGEATIRAARLGRDELLQLRAVFFERIVRPLLARWQRAEARGDAETRSEVVADARLVVDDGMPYAGMSRYFLRDAGIPV